MHFKVAPVVPVCVVLIHSVAVGTLDNSILPSASTIDLCFVVVHVDQGAPMWRLISCLFQITIRTSTTAGVHLSIADQTMKDCKAWSEHITDLSLAFGCGEVHVLNKDEC